MKLKLLSLITVLFISFVAKAQWNLQYHGTDTTDNIVGVSFISPSTGYVAFSKFIGYSTDTGKSYSRNYIQTANVDFNGFQSVDLTLGFIINGVKAISKDSLFVFGSFSFEPSILFSSNGGSTWKLVMHTSSTFTSQTIFNNIVDLKFGSNGTAIALDDEGIFRSTDYGQTWTSVYFLQGQQLSRISFASNNTIYVCGGPNVVISNDGGLSWTNIIPSSIQNRSNNDFDNIFFFDVNNGYTANGGNGIIYHISNYGSTWTQMNDSLISPIGGNDMYFTNDSTCFVFYKYYYSIYKTVNYGKTWEQCISNFKITDPGYGLNCMNFYNNQYAWAGGDKENLLFTNAGGVATYPKAFFSIDTTNISLTNKVNLNNLSSKSYQSNWIINGVSISNSFNSSYIHNIYKSIDTIQLIVKNNGMSDTLTQYKNFNVSPYISSFSPAIGITGTTITIKGFNFRTATSVSFGGVNATSFIVISDSIITAIVGNGSSGNISVSSSFYKANDSGFVYCTAALMPSISISSASTTICAGTDVNFTATINNGGNNPLYQWYKNGIAVGYGTVYYDDYGLNNGDSVNCYMTSNSGCPGLFVSNTLKFTVNSLPVLTLTNTGTSNCVNASNLLLSSNKDLSEIDWYNNSNLLVANKISNAGYGVTVGANIGKMSPFGLCVDKKGNIYVADEDNNQILRFSPHATKDSVGVVVAGGNSSGSALNQLNYPEDVKIDINGYLYVADAGNNRIIKFPPGSNSSTNGVIVAGGNGGGYAANQITPNSIFIDTIGNIIVCDVGNSRILKFPPNSNSTTNGYTIAGKMNNSQYLNSPSSVYADKNGNYYVADKVLKQVILYPSNSDSNTIGTVIVKLSSNTYIDQLNIFVDDGGSLFLSDANNNVVLRYPPNANINTSGIVVAGGNGYGYDSTHLYLPYGIFVDKNGILYISDRDNYRILKWNLGLPGSTYKPTSLGTYSVIATDLNGCAVESDSFTLSSSIYNPQIEINTNSTNICEGTNASFNASIVNGGTNPIYQWQINGVQFVNNSPVFSSSNLNIDDTVSCLLISNNPNACNDSIRSNLLIMNILTTPKVSISGNSQDCFGNTILVLNGANKGDNVIWKNDTSILLSTNATPPAGYSIVSDNKYYSGPSLYSPSDVKLDSHSSIYICDVNNVDETDSGATNIYSSRNEVVGGGEILQAQGIYIDKNNFLYMADKGKNEVLRYQIGTNSNPIILAGDGQSGSDANQFNQPYSVCTDNAGNIYVADFYNHRVQKFPPNSDSTTKGITVAGGNGQGNAANQLFYPSSIFVDTKGYLYVADYFNARVQKFPPGSTSSTNGITIINKLNAYGIYLDDSGYVYVSSAYNGVYMFPPNTDTTIIGKGIFSSSDPAGLCVDEYRNVFVSSPSQKSIYKIPLWWSGIRYNPTTSGTYTATVTNSTGCSTTTNAIVINPNVNPNIVINANPSGLIPSGSLVTFIATSINGGNSPSYQWFKNGVAISGADSTNYTCSNLKNNDTIRCVLTSNASCIIKANDTSNNIIVNVSSAIVNTIKGSIISPLNKAISNTELNVSGTTTYSTDINGSYNISLLKGGSFDVIPYKNNDINKTNGVTALDIALTQADILSKKMLNNAFKLIAADVNGDGKITALDIVYMKRLILGIDTTFINSVTKQTRLWAFIDSSYKFADTTNPFPFKDSISYTNLNASQTNQTFIGCKLGDVNWDWNPAVARPMINNLNAVELSYSLAGFYPSDALAGRADGLSGRTDGYIRIPVKVKNFKDMLGMQFTISFNANVLQWKGISNNPLNIETGTNHAAEGSVTFLWVDAKNEIKTLEDGSVIMELVFNPTGNCTNEQLDLNSSITSIAAYDKDYNLHGIVLNPSLINITDIVKETWIIAPNPTKDGVIKVQMNLNNSKTIVFRLSDNTGRVLMVKQVEGVKGTNNITLREGNIPTGTYYLQATGVDGEEVKKIMVQ